MKNKKILLLVPFMLVLIYFILTLLLTPSTDTPLSRLTNLFSPTKFVTQPQNNSDNLNQTNPPLRYDIVAVNKMISKLENRVPLNDADKNIEDKLVGTTNRQPKDLYITQNYKILYIPSIDLFMVQITSTDINKAKDDATGWFIKQGFSNEAICNKPVTFYVSWDIAQQLRPLNITFNPLAEGC